MNPRKPVRAEEIILTLEVIREDARHEVVSILSGPDLKNSDASHIGSAIQRIVYEMLESAVDRLDTLT